MVGEIEIKKKTFVSGNDTDQNQVNFADDGLLKHVGSNKNYLENI